MARPETYIGLTLLGIAAFYVATLPFDAKPKDDAAPGVPGWDRLQACSDLVSYDGGRSLELHPDHTIDISDDADPDATTHGEWSLPDPVQSRYVLNLGAAARTYTVVAPPGAEGCMLVPGADVKSADLRESWFSAADDDDDD